MNGLGEQDLQQQARCAGDAPQLPRIEWLGTTLEVVHVDADANAGRLQCRLRCQPLAATDEDGAWSEDADDEDADEKCSDVTSCGFAAAGPQSMWQVLAAGWLLLRTSQLDGSGWYVAHCNAEAGGPRGLTRRQLAIAQLAAQGESNKAIAHRLGVSTSTVSDQLTEIRRKLGVGSRAELVSLVAELAATPVRELTIGGERIAIGVCRDERASTHESLTSAENEVATLAAQGWSNQRIALARGSHSRTVANQLASILRKLGLHSRAQLALHLKAS